MPTKTKAAEATTSTTTTKTRTPRIMTEAQRTLIDSAIAEMDAARNKMKSAKALAKVIDCVSKLDRWGIEQLSNAIQARVDIIKSSEAK